MDRRVLVVFLSLCSCGSVAGNNSSEPYKFRLVGGASRCEGKLKVKPPGRGWSGVKPYDAHLNLGHRVCSELDCGSALSVRNMDSDSKSWYKINDCEESSLNDCFEKDSYSTSTILELKCSDSVRLRGPSLCSGSLELHQDQSWTPVCEGGFDLQDAEVVCRELGCGAPSLLQGALYGEVRALGQTFLCEGHESALMDCPRSSSGNTCSSGTAVELTCSDPGEVRLVGGASRCDGTLQLKHLDDWRDVETDDWTLRTAAEVCRRLDCGSVVSLEETGFDTESMWTVSPSCVHSSSTLRECVTESGMYSADLYALTCSDSVRLRGPRLCSGSLELHQNQSWAPVCEGGFDLQDAEVVCRELGCGAPSLLQGALYGEVQALGQTFLCEGHESALMDCPRSSSGNTCSSGTAVELTCSEPAGVRLVGGASRCAGTVELRHRAEWRRLNTDRYYFDTWTKAVTASVCRDLNCGSAVSGGGRRNLPEEHVWRVSVECVTKAAPVRECVQPTNSTSLYGIEVVCSDFLPRPNISLSVSADGVSEAQPQGLRVLLGSDFSVRCSVEPQYPGGSFQLLSPTVDPAQSHTLPAVNHSAHFLFSDAGSAHKGGYTCVYHLHVFSHNFSSQSHTLCLTLGVLGSDLILRVVLVLLLKLIYILALSLYYCKATRGQWLRRQ